MRTGAHLRLALHRPRDRERLSLMLADLASMGVPVDGDLGSSSPLEAIAEVWADHQFDEIIVTTLPRHVFTLAAG